jgi:hypothetical protein
MGGHASVNDAWHVCGGGFELDGWIVPQRNARLDHPDLLVTNYQLSDVGHLSLPVDPRAVRIVVSALAQLDPNQPPRERNMAAQVDGVAADAAANVTNSSPTSNS